MYAYKIPGNQGNPNSFFADNTHVLGTVDQAVDAKTIVSINYAGLIPAVTVTGYSFRVTPGGEPQLGIAAPFLVTPNLAISVHGGIAGVTYTIDVIALLADGEKRVDTLTVNVQGDGCGCGSGPTLVLPPPYTSSDGGTYANDIPRFFVSATPPVNPRVLDRWFNVVNQAVYDYISNGAASYWVVKINPAAPAPANQPEWE